MTIHPHRAVAAAFDVDDWLLIADALDTLDPEDSHQAMRARVVCSAIRTAIERNRVDAQTPEDSGSHLR
jgi:hypothetical protein